MSSPQSISIIICTRDRATDLKQTLDALGYVRVPDGLAVELVVVDNGSKDATPDVVAACRLPNIPVRYLSEPRRGQVHARNTGLAETAGEIVIFTDDDVRPAVDWIERVTAPILNGEADAVAGAVHIAPQLLRSWMGRTERVWLASTEHFSGVDSPGLVGANMAFARKVLDRVPTFDPELGPGALGFMDDTLFSSQLRAAGFGLVYEPGAVVIHHFMASRLLRPAWLAQTAKAGRSEAYVAYHWEHTSVRFPRVAALRARFRLAWWRLWRWRDCHREEGFTEWELNLVKDVFFAAQFVKERRRPRLYHRHGLSKSPKDVEARNPGAVPTTAARADRPPAGSVRVAAQSR